MSPSVSRDMMTSSRVLRRSHAGSRCKEAVEEFDLVTREMVARKLVTKERKCLADPNYMTTTQKRRITPHMRCIVVDWLFEVQKYSISVYKLI